MSATNPRAEVHLGSSAARAIDLHGIAEQANAGGDPFARQCYSGSRLVVQRLYGVHLKADAIGRVGEQGVA